MNIFIRSKLNPILKPSPDHKWENFKVYNPGAIFFENKYHLFYRAMGRGRNWHSSIGYASSLDGKKFTRYACPLLSPEGSQEKSGLEDPRITKINNTFYMAYAAYDGKTPILSIATSNDLMNWQRHGKALKDFSFEKNGGEFIFWKNGKQQKKRQSLEWSKSGAILPKKIQNRFWMLFGEYRIWLASSKDGLNWKLYNKLPYILPRKGKFFDNTYVEMGPPPIKTNKGWLVLYHGIDDKNTYRLGYFLLDLDNPAKMLYRSRKAVFEPQEPYELSGAVDIIPGGLKKMQKMDSKQLKIFIKNLEQKNRMPKVIFCCGIVKSKDKIRIYYGAGDSVICTATAKIDDILSQK